MTLMKNAYCVVEIPLRHPPLAAAGEALPTALHGERIDSQADA
jgi:hypothetical protein